MKTYYSKHFTIADNGHLHMDGVDLIDVAKQYGTPAYVMSESQLRELLFDGKIKPIVNREVQNNPLCGG